MSRDKCSFCETPWSVKEKMLRDEIGRLNDVNFELNQDLQAMGKSVDIRVKHALACALRYGGTDGSHHKTWVIDQMIRWLTGDEYERVVAEACAGEDGPNTYAWDVGVAP